jgi:hypothetical protein
LTKTGPSFFFFHFHDLFLSLPFFFFFFPFSSLLFSQFSIFSSLLSPLPSPLLKIRLSRLHFRLPLKKTHIHNPFLGDFIKPNRYRSHVVCGLPFSVWAGCSDLCLGLAWWSRLGLAWCGFLQGVFKPISAWAGCLRQSWSQLGFLRCRTRPGMVEPWFFCSRHRVILARSQVLFSLFLLCLSGLS